MDDPTATPTPSNQGELTIAWTDRAGTPWLLENVRTVDVDGEQMPVMFTMHASQYNSVITHNVLQELPLLRLVREQLQEPTASPETERVDVDHWVSWLRKAVTEDANLAGLRPVLEHAHEPRRWHTADFWPALLCTFEDAQARTEQPTLALAKALNTTPNAVGTLLYRARKKQATPAEEDKK